MFDAELARDGSGNKTVGGGHHRAQIGRMTRDKRARSLAHHRHDLRLHVAAMPFVELAARITRQRLQLKIEKLVYVERAFFVLLVEFLITRFVDFAIEYTLLDQKLRPLKVAVAGKQRVIQIK